MPESYEGISALFGTLDPIDIPPYCPKEGETYLYKWEDDFHKDDWRSDGYRWKQNGSVKSHKHAPGLSKKFFQVYDGPQSWTNKFARIVYFHSDYPKMALVQYCGDHRVGSHSLYSRGGSVHGQHDENSQEDEECKLPCMTVQKRPIKRARHGNVLGHVATSSSSCNEQHDQLKRAKRSSPVTTTKTSTTASDSEQFTILMEPYNYLLRSTSKVQSRIAEAFNYWLEIPEDKLATIIEMTRMLHNASLLFEDIEDGSSLRQAKPAAHHIYGVAHTINTANYVYFLGLQKALALNHPMVTQVFTEQLLELFSGRDLDIHWRSAVICPTEEEYKLMVTKKTGGLFGLVARMMLLFSTNDSDLKPLIDTLGIYIQICEDYTSLKADELQTNEGYAGDLSEGKFTFPVIHGIRSHPDDHRIVSILRQKTKDRGVLKHCIEYLESIGSFAYTQKVLIEYETRVLQQIEALGGNPRMKAWISQLQRIYTTD